VVGGGFDQIFLSLSLSFPLLFLTPSLYYLPTLHLPFSKIKDKKERKKKREEQPEIGQK
jgi:hypothetical protein